MTDTSREAVERLLDGVTPGPWVVGDDQCVDDTWSIVTTSGGAVLANVNDRPARTANARFIAAARDLVPALLARTEAAEARLHEFQAAQGYRYIGRDMKPVLARDLEDRAEAAEAKLARAVEALGFYGNEAAWNQPPVEVLEGEFGPAYRNAASKMQKDRGKLARTIIKEVDNG